MESIAKISNVEITEMRFLSREKVDKVAWGLIKDDKSTHGNHPFPDGTEIRTSPIKEIVEEDGVKYIITENSTYEVVGEIKNQD